MRVIKFLHLKRNYQRNKANIKTITLSQESTISSIEKTEKKENMESLLSGPDKNIWNQAGGNKLGNI